MVQQKLLTASEVADWLQVNVETVYRLIANEGLKASKIGGQWRFQQSKVRQWIEARAATSDPSADRQI